MSLCREKAHSSDLGNLASDRMHIDSRKERHREQASLYPEQSSNLGQEEYAVIASL